MVKPSSLTQHCAVFVGVWALLQGAGSHGFAQAGPGKGLTSIAGSWSGSGLLHLEGGRREQMTCRVSAHVSGGGMTGQQTLRCSSPRHNVNLTSSMQVSGESVSGSWHESNRGKSGSLSGRIRGGTISLGLTGVGFSASLSMNVTGCRQSITVRMTSSEVQTVNLQLSKGGC